MARSWLGQRQAHGPVIRRHDRRHLRKPVLEVLEDRTLLSFIVPALYPTDAGPVAVAVADLRHDGIQDVVTANRQANTVSAEKGRGSFREHDTP